ncbi:MAG: K(+)-transporting ATPase subunit F [Acidimicrobiales bacterium]
MLGAGSRAGARRMTVDFVLLAVSVILFVYLGVALFKPEWF